MYVQVNARTGSGVTAGFNYRRDMVEDDDAAPGWDAITAALERLHPGQATPPHWATGTNARALFGGPEFIDGISAYGATEPEPHWHYVTFGLTELYFKEDGADPDVSGWGFELTVRAPRDGDVAPVWPTELLSAVARHIASTELAPPVGSWFRAGEPLAHLNSQISGFLFAADPDLVPIATEHGRVAFLQVVGLLEDELDWCAEHGGSAFIDGPGRQLPRLMTTPPRGSLLAP
jgi:suppressor of fused-like protein